MTENNIKYFSTQVIDELYASISDNLDRYEDGDFLDLDTRPSWALKMSMKADLSPLKELVMERGADADIENSKLVWRALNTLKPALASENRFWSRLTHFDCLEYSRRRWLNSNENEEVQIGKIEKHFFANTLTRYRDDNAISRLWWNAYVAKMAAPKNQEQALKMIAKTADIRSNIVERSHSASRPVITAGIVRVMLSNGWLTEKEKNFREFMKAVNKHGGGKVFELWTINKVDEFMNTCFQVAKKR